MNLPAFDPCWRPFVSCFCGLFLLGSSIAAATSPDVALAAAEPSTPAEVYGEGVRSTAWRSAADERAGFHLPPGFEIRLFAAEPQIAKPLNMAQDAQGRLWVTQSTRYPYPGDGSPEEEAAADAVMILEDGDGDGHAESVTKFADGLNIPIGVLPYGDGCLCFSIPNLWYLRDTDGDGRCDRREVVLGPFDTTRDTHGMVNALRDGGDGWIYACHGFNNQSSVAGTDGHRVTMHSGNTFRFRPDGSRVELVTQGQVNPFGMTEDEWGYRYSADCHSKPITQLISGACYPSFGRPHDGLGFLPPTVEHLHGSTAISGIVYVPSDSSLVPLRGQLLSGNVMTSRLNRNRLTYRGATARGEELPDFLTSDDPWFRPVDLQLGPDDCLYVADFYNRIIGHYEVPLEHPGRDRTSGRIWQIRYVGESKAEQARTLDQQAAQMRMDRLRQASASAEVARLAREALSDPNAHVARLAAEQLGRSGTTDDVAALLDRLQDVDDADPVLRQTIRIAIARRLRVATGQATVWNIAELPPTQRRAMIDLLPAVDRPESTEAILTFLRTSPIDDKHAALFQQVAARATAEQLVACVAVARQLAGDDRDQQLQWLEQIWNAQHILPGKPPAPLRQWAAAVVEREWEAFIATLGQDNTLVAWHSRSKPVGSAGAAGAPWPLQTRQTQAGAEAAVRSSFVLGESYTGTYQTEDFDAPVEIQFWLAGHNGFPDRPDHHKNRVRLIDTETGNPLREAFPPRSDVAIRVRWDTSDIAGRKVRLECIDGDDGSAYAWLAVGGFLPTRLDSGQALQAFERALKWIERGGLDEHADRLLHTFRNPAVTRGLRLRIAQTVAGLRGSVDSQRVLVGIGELENSTAVTDDMLLAIVANQAAAIEDACRLITTRLPTAEQRRFTRDWVHGAGSLERLLAMMQAGWLSADGFADDSLWQAVESKVTAEQRSLATRFRQQAIANRSSTNATLERLQSTIDQRLADVAVGGRLYKQHCAACHQLRGEGAVVGPQLDGAVARPRTRLLEDVLTPNRNIDHAFRATQFLTEAGQVIVGLVQSETDTSLQIVDGQGKSQALNKATIEVRKTTNQSLMPNNFDELLTDQQLTDLLGFIKQSSDTVVRPLD